MANKMAPLPKRRMAASNGVMAWRNGKPAAWRLLAKISVIARMAWHVAAYVVAWRKRGGYLSLMAAAKAAAYVALASVL